MTGALLVTGTTSDAGKSILTAGICRWLHRNGVRVAPFKSQNMSNNSAVVVTADGRGGELGRAQAMQAAACGIAPDLRFNPVLLKPGSDRSSQVVLLGEAVDTVTAGNYRTLRPRLAETAFAAFEELRSAYDVLICEGAGSPTEINLRDGDFVNMGLARRFGLPTVVVGDIDRGGVFAAFFGTLALLAPEDQELVAGFVINKFRGDPGLLRPGLDMITKATGRPVHGVLPFHLDVWLDAEDSLAYGRVLGRPGPPRGTEWLRVAVVRLPRISNATDVEALAAEPGVQVRLTIEPGEIADADLVVLPGSKATVSDLAWLRDTGLAGAIHAHAAAGRPLLGVCGGYQMLAETIHDEVESGHGTVPGLGLLPVGITFAARKTLARPAGSGLGAPVRGYEIHHGYVSAGAPDPLLRYDDGRPEGAVAGNVYGTHWHGAFESDEFRRRFLTEVARRAGRRGFTVAPDTRFAAVRERALDVLGDLVEENLDTAALWRLIEQGAPPGLLFLPPGAP
ncbi:adenosylcobyric acid synthase [Actinoplanes campanulatus]|uniref:Cobyric acid synthase n=1 Tax=Actinoplanes campanulatus TaxID=113559 RepID=A0A7W5AS66_9ACTN|nr:cobyric acid synthase [Actinoplanes campanulatus]MBB3101345.1 adenosylcobyric acid synthase [Actinoplanes campanulatus]GGN48374.1 cobyric acid synthase [Actinoplanes campanulatus]GID41734.1 cobyric acid synthase [Actinoplanes campanulatus]